MMKSPTVIFTSLKSSSAYLALWTAISPSSLRLQEVSAAFGYSTRNYSSYSRLYSPQTPIRKSGSALYNVNRKPSSLIKRSMTLTDQSVASSFCRGDKIQVEIARFGPLGANVEVIAHNSHDEREIITADANPLGYGLILQKEIHYFRAARDGFDVVLGEILPAYVEKVRPEDGKLNITLRVPGGKAKADDLAKVVLERCQSSDSGEIDIGDKSTPESINKIFPGASKVSFKKAVGILFRKGLVQPGPYSIRLMKRKN